jgi:glycerol-3-phosphate acyltransferase PlsX
MTSPKVPVWIAIDAMGGDFAPHEIVKGAVLGARTYRVGIQLVGNPDAIRKELSQCDVQGLEIEIVPASEVIDMDEAPSSAVRRKKDASIVVTAKQVGQGKAQAMVAAGSTGAAMASAFFYIGRIDGIERPAIGVTLPSLTTPCMLIDAGANAECTPSILQQFAHMGSIFMQNVYQIAQPRVGVLTNGSEEGKGNTLVKETYALLETDRAIHFIGNVEGRDIFLGNADVAVCDGFTGNVALKSAEGVASLLKKLIKAELTRNLPAKLVGLVAKPALARAIKRVDHEEFGGALLLGVNGICVIAHGGSSANAIKNAIRVAKEAIDRDVLGKIGHHIPVSVGS